MKELKNSKVMYDKIEIPAELDAVVRNTIAACEEKKKQQKESGEAEKLRVFFAEKKRNYSPITRFIRYTGTMAAALLIALTIGLNTSESFAMEMSKNPVLGQLARILTIRSYHGFQEEKGIHMDIEVPGIELAKEEEEDRRAAGLEEGLSRTEESHGGLAKEKEGIQAFEGTGDKMNGMEEYAAKTEDTGAVEAANIDIQRIVDSHLAQAERDFQEYKEVFLENGGSEEEWAGRTMDLDVSYQVKYQSDEIISLVLYYSEVSVSAYEKAYYYNIDVKNNRQISLRDVLGEDYISLANEEILSQMKQRMAEDENVYYWGMEEEETEMEGFTSVDENTTFYINEAENPVVTFEEYEVAPGFMGIQEFEIPLK